MTRNRLRRPRSPQCDRRASATTAPTRTIVWKPIVPDIHAMISNKIEEFPRLCRGGSNSLTFTGVFARAVSFVAYRKDGDLDRVGFDARRFSDTSRSIGESVNRPAGDNIQLI